MGLCRTCNGSGSIWTPQDEWWPCPACGGAGARFLFGPPEYVMRQKRRPTQKDPHHGR